MRWITRLMGCSSIMCAAAGIALGANCYVNVYNLDCCELSLIRVECRACTNDPNCCDTKTSSGTVTHHKSAAPGIAGNSGTVNGPSCTCTFQAMKCSVGGYCVPFLDPIPESITPSSAGGGSACQGSA